MIDVRATVESMRRSVTNAQSSIEQLRHTHDKVQLDDISDCLKQITNECAVVTESVSEAKKPLAELETTVKRKAPRPNVPSAGRTRAN
jgi:archaellum component FlaC